ncbi:MAG TPA: SLATT domain-containing protein [Allosphingosinicella sp.]|jgi:hypothetical protein
MMDKDGLLRTIAETGYNVGFGARKTFATFDIVEKFPSWIAFASFAIGTFALFTESLSAKTPSALLLIAGVGSMYFGFYRSADYEATAKQLLKLQNRLRDLYRSVRAGADLVAAKAELDMIEAEYYLMTLSKQVFLSDWYAHYKFFAQSQIDWMDEQLHFRFWKDKVPLSAKVFAIISTAAIATFLAWMVFGLSPTAARPTAGKPQQVQPNRTPSIPVARTQFSSGPLAGSAPCQRRRSPRCPQSKG